MTPPSYSAEALQEELDRVTIKLERAREALVAMVGPELTGWLIDGEPPPGARQALQIPEGDTQ